MSTHIALLRGINVGGHNKVAMSDLRALLENLGFDGVKSLLQTGNLVFNSDGPTAAALEVILEQETAARLSLSVDFMVRSTKEWKSIVARNPFPNEAKADPGHLVVMFLKGVPSGKNVDGLRASIRGPEVLHHDGKQLYVYYPAGIGRSKLTGNLIERTLQSRGTVRNWNTVLKLAALCA